MIWIAVIGLVVGLALIGLCLIQKAAEAIGNDEPHGRHPN